MRMLCLKLCRHNLCACFLNLCILSCSKLMALSLLSDILDSPYPPTSQAHLCPLPLQIAPIFWAFDHALALYPAPDGLVLADSVDQYRTSYNQVWSGEEVKFVYS